MTETDKDPKQELIDLLAYKIEHDGLESISGVQLKFDDPAEAKMALEGFIYEFGMRRGIRDIDGLASDMLGMLDETKWKPVKFNDSYN